VSAGVPCSVWFACIVWLFTAGSSSKQQRHHPQQPLPELSRRLWLLLL
jgi:hypothetical protein